MLDRKITTLAQIEHALNQLNTLLGTLSQLTSVKEVLLDYQKVIEAGYLDEKFDQEDNDNLEYKDFLKAKTANLEKRCEELQQKIGALQ